MKPLLKYVIRNKFLKEKNQARLGLETGTVIRWLLGLSGFSKITNYKLNNKYYEKTELTQKLFPSSIQIHGVNINEHDHQR